MQFDVALINVDRHLLLKHHLFRDLNREFLLEYQHDMLNYWLAYLPQRSFGILQLSTSLPGLDVLFEKG